MLYIATVGIKGLFYAGDIMRKLDVRCRKVSVHLSICHDPALCGNGLIFITELLSTPNIPINHSSFLSTNQ